MKPLKPGWRKMEEMILIQKDSKKYFVDPKNPSQVYMGICRFPNTDREYYELKPIEGVDLTRELKKLQLDITV